MYHIGIDVAKHHHDAIGLDDAGRTVLSPFWFPNTRAGAEKLVRHLQALNGEVHLAMESTGHYWIALYEYLVDHGYKVTTVRLGSARRERTRWTATSSPTFCASSPQPQLLFRPPPIANCAIWPVSASA